MTVGTTRSKAPPIFVVGPPRSGTTLTARILGRHPNIFMPGETHFLDDVYARRSELGDPKKGESLDRIVARLSTIYRRFNEMTDQDRINHLFTDPAVIASFQEGDVDYARVFSHFMEIQMVHERKNRWGNNVPRDIFNLDAIMSFYPHAKIVICIRDVRDFLLSYRNKWKITPSENAGRLMRLYHPVLTSLLWKASVGEAAKVLQRIPAQNVYVLRYEDLARNPVQKVSELCDFLDEVFDEDMLSIEGHNSSHGTATPAGVYRSSIARWRQERDAVDTYVAQMITRKEMQWFGYEPEAMNVSAGRVLCAFASFPIAGVRAVYANRGHQGRLIPYLLKRLRSVAFQ